jgi:hypothetical protein
MDFFDYSSATIGMTYYNSLNTPGVTIDGSPDSVVTGLPSWEMVTGAQGTLAMAGTFATNIPGFAPTSYYLDDATPPVAQCTGDAFAYGSSGVWLNQNLPCTDAGCAYYLTSTRAIYYDAPSQPATLGSQRALELANPLAFSVQEVLTDVDGDGLIDDDDNCPTVANPGQEDGDGDRLGDACEASVYGTDPADPDTDGDRCFDGWEAPPLDPTDPDDFPDIDLSGAVGFGDFVKILAAWGATSAGPAPPWDPAADLDNSDAVGFGDFVRLLAGWGRVCE